MPNDPSTIAQHCNSWIVCLPHCSLHTHPVSHCMSGLCILLSGNCAGFTTAISQSIYNVCLLYVQMSACLLRCPCLLPSALSALLRKSGGSHAVASYETGSAPAYAANPTAYLWCHECHEGKNCYSCHECHECIAGAEKHQVNITSSSCRPAASSHK